MNIITVNHQVSLASIVLYCGHSIYVPVQFYEHRMRDGQVFYCTACGCEQQYPLSETQEPKRSATILKLVKE